MQALSCARWTLLGVLAALAFVATSASAAVKVSETSMTLNVSSLTFRGSAELSVACAVTLRASLIREIALTGGPRVGEITEARTERCTGGTVTFLAGFPWPIHLVSFREGVLNWKIEGMAFLIRNSLGTQACLYRGNAQVRNAEDPIRTLRFVEGVNPSLLTTLTGTCPASASLTGTLGTNEVAYKETVAAGDPLQPAAAELNYNNTIQVREMTFRNEWIIPVFTSGNTIGAGGGRFLQFPEFGECFELARINPAGTCTDKIRLWKAREALEAAEVPYSITLLNLPIGEVTLRN